MTRRFLQVLTLAASLALGSVALAGTIHTPPIGRTPTVEDDVLCLVANTASHAIGPLSVRVYRSSGIIANSVVVESLEPKATLQLRAPKANLGPTGGVFCEVEGTGVSRRRTPTTLCVVETGSDTCLGSVSVP